MTISWINFGTRNNSAGATTRTNGTVVAGIAAGDLLYSVCGIAAAETITLSTPAGFTTLAQWAGTGIQAMGAWKISDGAEATGPTFTWTSSVACFTLMYAWRSTVGFASTPMVVKNTNSGTTATHSVTGFNWTQAASWAIYSGQALANTAYATPANFIEDRDGGSATGNTRDATGNRASTGAGNACGNISITAANAAWLMQMIELVENISAAKHLALLGVG